MEPLRVLYLTSRAPAPAVSGGQLREYEILRRLSATHTVDLVLVTQFDEDRKFSSTAECADEIWFFDSPVGLGPEPAGSGQLDSVLTGSVLENSRGEQTSLPQRVTNQANPAVVEHVRQQFQQRSYDVIHVEGYYMLQHVPPTSVPIVLIEENIEFAVDKRTQELAGEESPKTDWRLARGIEVAAWRCATVVAGVTDEDAELIHQTSGVRVAVSFDGTDHLDTLMPTPQPSDGSEGAPIAIFVGNYSYPPTRDAADHLLGDIWPRIVERVPQARLQLVGHSMPADLEALAHRQGGVDVVGWVDALGPALDRATAMIAPVRIGGGIKVKIVEAIRRGCPVVTTPIGAQGFPIGVRELLHVGDDALTLTRHACDLLGSPDTTRALRPAIEAAARRLPSWDDAAERLQTLWRTAQQIHLSRDPMTVTGGLRTTDAER